MEMPNGADRRVKTDGVEGNATMAPCSALAGGLAGDLRGLSQKLAHFLRRELCHLVLFSTQSDKTPPLCRLATSPFTRFLLGARLGRLVECSSCPHILLTIRAVLPETGGYDVDLRALTQARNQPVACRSRRVPRLHGPLAPTDTRSYRRTGSACCG